MKKNIRRLLFALGLVAILFGAWVLVMLFIGRTAAPSVLPNPNGYDDLLKAGGAVIGKIDDAPSLSHDELRALVVTNSEALRLLRVGFARPCVVPTDEQISKFSTLSSDLIALKSLAKLLTAEGRLAEIENRPADAARSYVDAIRLGNEMSRGGLMMNRLVGIACEGTGSIPLVKLLPQLTCEEIQPMIANLEKIDSNTVSWREIIQNENRFARAQMGNYPNPIKLLLDLWQVRNIRKASEERHDLAATHLRLLTVELALRSYKCDQGSAPENITQLVPKYLQRLPIDPFSGNPMAYRPRGTNWLLYSFGPDRVDNGGTPISKTTSGGYPFGSGDSNSGKGLNKGDLLYDSGW